MALGTKLLQATIQHVRENTNTEAIVLEVESDRHGSPDVRQLKTRRIVFYERNGACIIEAITDYQMPNMIGLGSIPINYCGFQYERTQTHPREINFRYCS